MGIFQVLILGPKEELESVFKKIDYEHTSDLNCKCQIISNPNPQYL